MTASSATRAALRAAVSGVFSALPPLGAGQIMGSEKAMSLLVDLLLGLLIWFVVSLVLVGVFPGETSPDGARSHWWLLLVGFAVVGAIVVYRQRQRRHPWTPVPPSTRTAPGSTGRSDPGSRSAVSPAQAPSLTRHARPAQTPPTKHTARKWTTAWVPVGESVTVKGRRLPDGMVYVGAGLRGIAHYVGTEPALIDPQLPVDTRAPDMHGRLMGYWPSYSDIPAASRAAYLDWLAAGRPEGASIGYVFLFFYGIERRLLYDIDRADLAGAEAGALIAEVERLLLLYGKSHAFRGYAGEFLSLVTCLRTGLDAAALAPPRMRRRWEFPLELKLGLGSIVASGAPLPAPWALAWLRLHPEVGLRTPATRCAEEFDALFQLRYRETHGPGLKIRRNKRTLTHSYQPASASFGSPVRVTVDALPDVSGLTGPVRRLQKLAEGVTDDLDAYSRWVGRHGDRESLAALALLPRELLAERDSNALRLLKERMEAALAGKDVATVGVAAVVAGFPSRKADGLSTKEAATFAQLLERIGFGLAPDIRYSKINWTKHRSVAVFRLSDQPSQPSDKYQAAAVLLHLGAAVGAADGTVTADEERLLETHLEEALDLPSLDRVRLRAHLQWLLVEPPTLRRMRSRIQALRESDRTLVARFVITIAGADGSISSDEIRVLGQVYKLIGLDGEQLHRDIHELLSTAAAHPITVLRPDEPTGYPVPPPPPASILAADRVELDRGRIAEVMKATREVSDLLTEVFEGPEDPEPSEEDIADTEPADPVTTKGEMGDGVLDAAHGELVRFLATRPTWPRQELEAFATRVGLMPAGAIETINEVAFARCDEPLIEGDTLLAVNGLALKELLDAD